MKPAALVQSCGLCSREHPGFSIWRLVLKIRVIKVRKTLIVSPEMTSLPIEHSTGSCGSVLDFPIYGFDSHEVNWTSMCLPTGDRDLAEDRTPVRSTESLQRNIKDVSMVEWWCCCGSALAFVSLGFQEEKNHLLYDVGGGLCSS